MRLAHPLVVELPLRLLGLGKMQAHGAEDARRFGELEIGIFDHLDAIAPWIEEIEKVAIQSFALAVTASSRTWLLSSTTSPKCRSRSGF